MQWTDGQGVGNGLFFGMTEQQSPETGAPRCPKCQGEMWDNRENKRNPRAPDFKCKDRSCDGVIWPPREGGAPAAGPAQPTGAADDPACPVCGGKMWDDRASKRNPRAPDFKCRNKPKERGGPGCEGVIWPSRDGSPSPYPPPMQRRSAAPAMEAPPRDDAPFPDEPPPFDDDDIPF
ncbi:MAG: hypothetical protein ACJ8AO_20355 [Gemmatimonadaceae bacterium]